MKYPSRQRFASLHEGLFFGGVLGLLLALNGALDLLANVTAGVVPLAVGGLFLFTYAAIRATYVTGKLGTGLLAGFWTGLVSGIINLAVLATLSIMLAGTVGEHTRAAAGASGLHITDAMAVSYDIGLLFFGVLMAVACGLVCGTAGGMIAIHRGRARQAAEPANGV